MCPAWVAVYLILNGLFLSRLLKLNLDLLAKAALGHVNSDPNVKTEATFPRCINPSLASGPGLWKRREFVKRLSDAISHLFLPNLIGSRLITYQWL